MLHGLLFSLFFEVIAPVSMVYAEPVSQPISLIEHTTKELKNSQGALKTLHDHQLQDRDQQKKCLSEEQERRIASSLKEPFINVLSATPYTTLAEHKKNCSVAHNALTAYMEEMKEEEHPHHEFEITQVFTSKGEKNDDSSPDDASSKDFDLEDLVFEDPLKSDDEEDDEDTGDKRKSKDKPNNHQEPEDQTFENFIKELENQPEEIKAITQVEATQALTYAREGNHKAAPSSKTIKEAIRSASPAHNTPVFPFTKDA